GSGRPRRRQSLHYDWCTESGRQLRRGPLQLLPDSANARIRGSSAGDDPRRAHHSTGRASASSAEHSPVEWRLARPMGGQDPGRRYNELLEPELLYGIRGESALDGTVHSRGPGYDRAQSDARRSDDLDQAVDSRGPSEAVPTEYL